jgi:hypothetical protein
VLVQGTDGSRAFYHIPLSLELGARQEQPAGHWQTLRPWRWTDPTYTFTIAVPIAKVQRVEIDPIGRLADVDRKNDGISIGPGTQGADAE